MKSGTFIKRTLDLLFSTLLLILFSPFLLIMFLLVWIDLGWPIFFTQERVGKDKKVFYIYKFRSMKSDPHAEARLDFSRDEERLTPLGRFLRRTKIDELPQLLNVLKGEMSLVGPRPTVMQQVKLYTPHQMKRLLVKPGMTGLAQVNGNAALTWEERIQYDVEYVESQSLWLDVKILLKTILVPFVGEARFKKSDNEKE